jgi:FkbM family methyltransferase
MKDELVEPGDVIVDCGAHHGLTSVLFARWAGKSGRVIAFEANAANARIAKHNVELNGLENVGVVNAAVSSFCGTAPFLAHSNGALAPTPSDATVTVNVTTLDEGLDGIRPTLLKIDVEGHELEVLRGARRLLERRPKVALELHCEGSSTRVAVIDEILTLLPTECADTFIQLVVDGLIIPFEPRTHTPAMIAAHRNVHVFVRPRA